MCFDRRVSEQRADLGTLGICEPGAPSRAHRRMAPCTPKQADPGARPSTKDGRQSEKVTTDRDRRPPGCRFSLVQPPCQGHDRGSVLHKHGRPVLGSRKVSVLMAGRQSDVHAQLLETDTKHDRGQASFAMRESGERQGDSSHPQEHHADAERAGAGCDVGAHPKTDARSREHRDGQPHPQYLELGRSSVPRRQTAWSW